MYAYIYTSVYMLHCTYMSVDMYVDMYVDMGVDMGVDMSGPCMYIAAMTIVGEQPFDRSRTRLVPQTCV